MIQQHNDNQQNQKYFYIYINPTTLGADVDNTCVPIPPQVPRALHPTIQRQTHVAKEQKIYIMLIPVITQ